MVQMAGWGSLSPFSSWETRLCMGIWLYGVHPNVNISHKVMPGDGVIIIIIILIINY